MQGSQWYELTISLILWVSSCFASGKWFFFSMSGGAHGYSLLQVLSLPRIKGSALPKPRTSGVAGARRLGVQCHLPPRHVDDAATWAPGAGDQICPRLGKSQDITARWGRVKSFKSTCRTGCQLIKNRFSLGHSKTKEMWNKINSWMQGFFLVCF